MFRHNFVRRPRVDDVASSEGEDDRRENDSGSGSPPAEPEKKRAKLEDDGDMDEDDEEETSTFKSKVHQVLKKVTSAGGGEFAFGKHIPQAPSVVISIKDGGKMRFPMYEDEIEQIIDSFEKSPYGKGTETILDTSFRNSWELNPDGFTILNPAWDVFISEDLVPLIGKEFAMKSPFTASIYKLLLYKEDSFFKLHRDSEKEPGMFATVVVQLPSKYTGGELVVHHDNKTKTFDFSSTANQDAEFSTFFSAFYCDCLHEIRPLTSGIRVCLVYNLCLTGENVAPMTAPTTSSTEKQLGTLMQEWKDMKSQEPSKLVYGLSHKYTEKNLSFDNLKSTDKAVAKLFKQISTGSGISVLLAIFEKTTIGNEDGFDEEFDSDDSDGYCERHYKLRDFRMIDSSTSNDDWTKGIRSLTVEPESEVIPKDCWHSIEPYNTEKEETGNAGVQVSLFYRHAALVIWPTDDILELLLGAGGDMFVAEGIFLAECTKTRGTPMDDNAKAKAEEKLRKWANAIIKGVKCSRIDSVVQPGQGTALLSAIVDFNDLSLLKEFLKFRNAINPTKVPILLVQCEKYGWHWLSGELVSMFDRSGNSKGALEMFRLIIGHGPMNEEKRFVCLKLAQSVVTSRKTAAARPTYHFYSVPAKTPAQKAAELEADQEFLREFYTTVKGIGFDMMPVVESTSLPVVVPALLKIAAEAAGKGERLENSWVEMSESALKKMELRGKKPVVVPDWRRTDFKSCGCKDCISVDTFMRSTEITGRYKMGKQRRLHLHRIMNDMEDLTHITERGGSPETMVVTKTAKFKGEDYEEQQVVLAQKDKLKQVLQSAKEAATSTN